MKKLVLVLVLAWLVGTDLGRKILWLFVQGMGQVQG